LAPDFTRYSIEFAFGDAFNVGLEEGEIVEAVMTLIPYIGFPKALNAMSVVRRVVGKRNG
jgi:4-carboxymuconolactone decarboxylase